MVTIVSGLPRSGTSLMMQMLVAGGMTLLSDGERTADADNPRGYLEWECIKQLPNDPTCIIEAEGKVRDSDLAASAVAAFGSRLPGSLPAAAAAGSPGVTGSDVAAPWNL
jgi:hypothetical protein